jgi:hypothetical protein
MNYRCEYRYTPIIYGTLTHNWMLIGRWGGLNLRIEEYTNRITLDRASGGLEIHYRIPPSYMCNKPPSYDDCWLLKCPCWHDGTSLSVEEVWIPFWDYGATSHKKMFARLETQANEYFKDFISGEQDDRTNT